MANSPLSGGLVIRSPQQAAEEDAANRAAGLPDVQVPAIGVQPPAVTIEPAPPEPEPAASVPAGAPPPQRETPPEMLAPVPPPAGGGAPVAAPQPSPAPTQPAAIEAPPETQRTSSFAPRGEETQVAGGLSGADDLLELGRAAAERARREVAILQDLGGPKIRTGLLEGADDIGLSRAVDVAGAGDAVLRQRLVHRLLVDGFGQNFSVGLFLLRSQFDHGLAIVLRPRGRCQHQAHPNDEQGFQ